MDLPVLRYLLRTVSILVGFTSCLAQRLERNLPLRPRIRPSPRSRFPITRKGEPAPRTARSGTSTVPFPPASCGCAFDAAYDFTRPTRAEFFYARSQPLGPGLPVPEPRIDYQDLAGYLELAATDRLSGFVEVPWRFLNPEVNADTNGLADMNAGFKYAFLYRNDLVATFQFRTYIPTGDASRGLGTHHVSLEPAFLFYKPWTDRLGLEGEFRYWVPIDGTDFAGDLIRYGVGVHYDVWKTCTLTVSPVVEFVGWTVLSGKESAVTPSGAVLIEGAAGDTIVNAKMGVRCAWTGWATSTQGTGGLSPATVGMRISSRGISAVLLTALLRRQESSSRLLASGGRQPPDGVKHQGADAPRSPVRFFRAGVIPCPPQRRMPIPRGPDSVSERVGSRTAAPNPTVRFAALLRSDSGVYQPLRGTADRQIYLVRGAASVAPSRP